MNKNQAYPVLAIAVLLGFTFGAAAQTLVEHSFEARFQIDLKVPDAALKPFLPDGWTLNVAAQGPAKRRESSSYFHRPSNH